MMTREQATPPRRMDCERGGACVCRADQQRFCGHHIPERADCERTAARVLRLIAQGWTVIESDGVKMTIQAPDDWSDDQGTGSTRELGINTAHYG